MRWCTGLCIHQTLDIGKRLVLTNLKQIRFYLGFSGSLRNDVIVLLK